MVAVLEIWVFVIVLLVSLQSQVLVISQNLTCNSNDLTGLRGFMDGLESPIDGWWPTNSSSVCCNLVGVTCNSSSGRIVGLALQNKRLTGILSDLISNLNQLRTLNLSQNFLEGHLPISLFHLPHLEKVDLSSNEFDGVLPVTINLPALQVLDISYNTFIGSIPALQVLDISYNTFTGSIPAGLCVNSTRIRQIPEFLSRLPRLRELSLKDNMFISITGIGNSSSRLVRLDVSSNRLSGNVPDFFHSFPNLSYFSAHSNNLSGEIPPSLLNSQAISSLNLRNNSLYGSINFNCSLMVNLASLDLGSNNFSDMIPANLSLSFEDRSLIYSILKMVVVLEIWVLVIVLVVSLQSQVLVISQNPTCNSNDLTGLKGFMDQLESPIDGWPTNSSSLSSSSRCCNLVGITCDSSSGRIVGLQLQKRRLTGTFSDLISNLDQLRTLNLSHNFLKGHLPISLFHLPHLEKVDLSSNEFDGVLPVTINLPALQVLDISYNTFTGSIPAGLCVNSTRIRLLSLAVNYFDGIIPPQFGNCHLLQHLSVASNFLSGQIPEFLFRLPRLRELALQDNMFTSFTGIGNSNSSSRLFRLDVSSNRLFGNVPDVFHSFPNLSYFSAHSNILSGGIPSSLLNSQTISYLNLRNNSLDGSIDFNCSVTVNLTSLDLGTNNFSGRIPANLPSCLKLKAINLARNRLVGQVPESFKNFQSLSYLSLSNCSLNNLSTSLKILQHCPNLTVMVLSMNFLTEQLPSDDDLQFKSLKALVIANCRLTGGIPSWLNGLTELQLLDLSWNHLTGSIPAYLGDFQSLFYLDLSENSLSGEIPKNLTQLPSLISREISLEEPSPDFPFFKKRNIIGRGFPSQYNQIMSFPPSLDLSSNFLTGPIWAEFGNLKKLHVLDLKHNNLSGTIPGSLSGMRSIETMDLSYNDLSGTIPPSLVNLSFLSKFNVAYNDLTGIIPSRGQFLIFATSSFVGNPGLCGGYNLDLKCRKIEELLPTDPASDDDESFIVWMVSSIGFGTGFLVTVVILVVVPIIRDTKR
ncbi:hypothetical protein L6452_16919 [Arctium lappa]|uniref:Uncharacterized protein n=1 Tax=Arctium lappa TaxID=4217 RepID=A0ACB9C254_ARCLA|nr:hypothetical protein L6452_16919 [Arctium lappa]